MYYLMTMLNHYVRNDTPYRRVVLYLDVVRPELRDNVLVELVIYLLSKNIFVKNLDKSQHKQQKIAS